MILLVENDILEKLLAHMHHIGKHKSQPEILVQDDGKEQESLPRQDYHIGIHNEDCLMLGLEGAMLDEKI